MPEHPLTRQTVSVHLILPRKHEVQSDPIHSSFKEPTHRASHAEQSPARSRGRWLGILGLILAVTILGLTAYSIVKYLW